MINKFAILISFLPIITASGCSDEPVSGSVDVASTNREARFEQTPRSEGNKVSQAALRQQLRDKGWAVKVLRSQQESSRGLVIAPLGNQPFGDEDLLLLRRLENVHSIMLEEGGVDIEGTFTNKGLAYLSGMESVRSVRIWGTEINDAGLAHLTTLPNLKLLNIEFPKAKGDLMVTDIGMAHVKNIKDLHELRLYVSDNQLTEEGLKSLSELQELESLGLTFGSPFNNGELSLLGKFPSLRTLRIRLGENLGKGALKGIGAVKGLSSLDVSGPNVTDDDLKEISTLGNLTTLVVNSPAFTTAGVNHLARLEKLTTLDISGSGIKRQGLRWLVKLPQLETLAVRRLAVRDEDLTYLNRLARLHNLTLATSKVSDEGLSHLANIKSLRELHIYESDITDAGVQELKKALPNLVVEGNWQESHRRRRESSTGHSAGHQPPLHHGERTLPKR